MSDLPNLNNLTGTALTIDQARGILNQIDLDITNLVRDGKLSALTYSIGQTPRATVDRGANLKALLTARTHYARILQDLEQNSQPDWQISQATNK